MSCGGKLFSKEYSEKIEWPRSLRSKTSNKVLDRKFYQFKSNSLILKILRAAEKILQN